MGRPTVGAVVVIRFPFSNLQGSKLRPALVIAQAEFDNLVLCQITSKSYSSKAALPLVKTNFSEGGLPQESYIRPNKIFTADTSIIKSTIGHLDLATISLVLERVRALFLPSYLNSFQAS